MSKYNQFLALGLLGSALGFFSTNCVIEDECIWEPTVDDQGTTCVISTDDGEDYCWGGETITCVLNENSVPQSYTCTAEGERQCGTPIELTDVDSPSCAWFEQSANYEIYTDVWAECWEWETDWWYW